jgi:long-chain acyl-CoA synthetase
MIALGLPAGGTVGILGYNRPEWVIFDTAAMTAGAIPAGIYATSSDEECAYILNHCRAHLLLVEDEEQLGKIQPQLDQLPHLRYVITMRGVGRTDHPAVLTWEEFTASGEVVSESELEARLKALKPDDPATLIYTSGTTGLPKGVTLSHDNLVWTATQAVELLDLRPDERGLSYLPLSHIAEQMFSIHIASVLGWATYFAQSLEQFADNLAEVRPTFFFAVPRVWEKFRAGVEAKLDEATGAKARLVAWARDVATRVVDISNEGSQPGPLLNARYLLAHRLVLGKVKKALGLDQARVMASGAAPISPEVLRFFGTLDLPIIEVYGQSEGSGPTTVNRPGQTRFGSVGPEFPGTEVRIADDGEVLLKGRNVFLGYYGEPEATAATLIDGWLHSGDLGRVDEDGYFWITGRKKDIIITAGGKNLSPAAPERRLTDHRLIANAVVVGDRRRFLSVLIALEPEEVKYFMTVHGLEGEAAENEAVRREIQAAIDEVNGHFSRVGQIRKFAILPQPLSIDTGELTPTLKVKRNVVAERHADLIEELYAG